MEFFKVPRVPPPTLTSEVSTVEGHAAAIESSTWMRDDLGLVSSQGDETQIAKQIPIFAQATCNRDVAGLVEPILFTAHERSRAKPC